MSPVFSGGRKTTAHHQPEEDSRYEEGARKKLHEMGIALQVIEIAAASIPEDLPRARVVRVNLTVGKLSAVVSDSLRFCFEVAARQTPLEGAELAIEEVDVVARCNACRHRWTIEEPAFSCPLCRSGNITLISGRELDIRSIEIEDETKDTSDDESSEQSTDA